MTTSCSDSGWLHVLLSRTEMTELSLGISAAGSCASAARAKGRRPALLHTPGGRGQVACRASSSLVGGGVPPLCLEKAKVSLVLEQVPITAGCMVGWRTEGVGPAQPTWPVRKWPQAASAGFQGSAGSGTRCQSKLRTHLDPGCAAAGSRHTAVCQGSSRVAS